MIELLHEFQENFEREDKAACLRFARDGLDSGRFDIATLYDDILTPSLREVLICKDFEAACIWHEHVKSGILRAILENCYLHLDTLGSRKLLPTKTALVMCPERELHELGARMAADALTMSGFYTIFAGANTPRQQLLAAFLELTPDVVAISITDPFHLVEAQKALELLFAAASERQKKKPIVLAGGFAFRVNPNAAKTIGADGVADSFRSLLTWAKQLAEGVVT